MLSLRKSTNQFYLEKPLHTQKGKMKRSDEDLIQLYLESQDSRYFDMLYSKYATKVYSKCISLLKDEIYAQDATQDIFLKIFLNLAKFGGKSKFSTWVYSITYNYCIDLIRKKKKHGNIFSDDIERAPDLEEEVPDSALLEMEVKKLKVVLDSIPVGDKAVLLMKYQDEMSIKEISNSLNKSESAIKMKLKRAKHKAQKIYLEKFSSSMS